MTDAPGKPFAMLKDVEREDQTAIKSRTDSSYSDKDSLEEIKEANRSESEGPASEEDTMRKLDRNLYQAYADMVYNVSGELNDWLNSVEPLDLDAIKSSFEVWAKKYQNQLKAIARPYTGEAKKEAEMFSKAPDKGWGYACSEVFSFIIDSMSDVIWDEGETSGRGIRAGKIQQYLEDLAKIENPKEWGN